MHKHWTGQTTIGWSSEGLEHYLGSHDPAASSRVDSLLPSSPREHRARAHEIRQKDSCDRTVKEKLVRSFISLCVASWLKGELGQTLPKPPAPLLREIDSFGGNLKWLAARRSRRMQFLETAGKRSGRKLPYASVWIEATQIGRPL